MIVQDMYIDLEEKMRFLLLVDSPLNGAIKNLYDQLVTLNARLLSEEDIPFKEPTP